MKHLWLTVSLLAFVAAGAGLLSFRLTGDSEVKAALAHGDAMQWMRTEFTLSDAQFARIKQLHDAYSVQCEKHCEDIADAMVEVQRLEGARASAEDLAAAQTRLETLRLTCETAIAAHVRRCAEEMSPEAGKRYLALVLPKIAEFDHQAPPDVRLNHRHP